MSEVVDIDFPKNGEPLSHRLAEHGAEKKSKEQQSIKPSIVLLFLLYDSIL